MDKVPVKRYQLMQQRYPDMMTALEALGAATSAAGPLDERTSQLVQLGAAAAVRSEGAVHSHARRALQAGATPDEVHHALLLLTNTIGFPNVVAAMSWTDDILDANR